MSTWVKVRGHLGHGLTRFGRGITRLGDRVEGSGSWTGDSEVAWKEGYDFGRDHSDLQAEPRQT